MAILPFISSLSKSARTAYSFIKRGIKEGLSGRAIGQVLKDAGTGIRNQTLFEMIREIKGVEQKGSQLKFLPLNKRPNPERLPRSLTPIRNNYGFEVLIEGHQNTTGLRESRFITIGSDTLLTRGEIETLAFDAISENADIYSMNVEKITLTGGFRKGDFGLRPTGLN